MYQCFFCGEFKEVPRFSSKNLEFCIGCINIPPCSLINFKKYLPVIKEVKKKNKGTERYDRSDFYLEAETVDNIIEVPRENK